MWKVLIRQYSLLLAQYSWHFTHKVTPDKGCTVTLSQVLGSEVMVIANWCKNPFLLTEQILLRLYFLKIKKCAMIQNYLIFSSQRLRSKQSPLVMTYIQAKSLCLVLLSLELNKFLCHLCMYIIPSIGHVLRHIGRVFQIGIWKF